MSFHDPGAKNATRPIDLADKGRLEQEIVLRLEQVQ